MNLYKNERILFGLLIFIVMFCLFQLYNIKSVFSADYVEINLKAGWNAVSFPFRTITEVAEIPKPPGKSSSKQSSFTNIMSYAISYDPTTGTYNYIDLINNCQDLHQSQGYWINAYNDVTLVVTGNYYNGNVSSDVKDGWNQVGCPYNKEIKWGTVNVTYLGQTLSLNQAVSNSWIGLNGMLIWYNPQTGSYEYTTPFGNIGSKKGYWLSANVDCRLIFPDQIVTWGKCFGGKSNDVARSVQQTSDGGYIVTGFADSNDGDVTGNHGSGDYWVLKLNSIGIIEWQKCLGGTLSDDARSIQQTSDDGYIIAGYSMSNNGDVNNNHGNADYWIVKIDSLGNIEWQKCLGGSANDYSFSIQQTSDGGYITVGHAYSNDGNVSGNNGKYDYWVVKLNSLGIIEWQKSLGGTEDDIARSVQQTSDGGYIIAGYTFSNNGDVSGNHGSYDYWVVKLDSSGNLQWQKCLGGNGTDTATSIQQTSDEGYIVAGYTYSKNGDVSGNHGSGDYWIVKLDSSGNLQWQKCLGGSSDDRAYSIQQLSNGGYIVTGDAISNDGNVSGNHGNNDYWVVKLDSSGNIDWQNCVGGSNKDYALSIESVSDGGYVVAGYSKSNDGDVSGNNGAEDYWIVRLDSNGNIKP